MISLRHVNRIYPLKGGQYYALRNISLNQQEGVTIIQVTHSNDNAAYGSRVVRLQDGMPVK